MRIIEHSDNQGFAVILIAVNGVYIQFSERTGNIYHTKILTRYLFITYIYTYGWKVHDNQTITITQYNHTLIFKWLNIRPVESYTFLVCIYY